MKTAITALIMACCILLAPHRSTACGFTLSDSIVPVGCNGPNTGQLYFFASGNYAGSQYKLGINGTWAAFPNYSSGYVNNYFSLTAGTRDTMYVQDSTGCVQSLAAVIPLVTGITDTLTYVDRGNGNYLFTAGSSATSPIYYWYYDAVFSAAAADTFGYTFSAGTHQIISQIQDRITGCIVYDTVYITVPALGPAGPDQIICHGTSATLFATGTGTWTVVPGSPATPAIISPSSPTTAIINMVLAGQYQFVWHTSGGTDTVLLTVVPTYHLGIYEIDTFCQSSDTLQLPNLPSGAVVTWYRNNLPLGVISDYLPIGYTSGTYMGIATSPNGCQDTAILSLAPCNNLYTNLAATICAGNTYTFHGHQLTASGVYTDTLNASSGYDSIITLTLTVNPSLNLNITQSGSICTGNDTLTVSGAGTNALTWLRNGVVVSTGPAVYSPYTVAGGNGSGSAANRFSTPYGVAVDAAGNIYALDQGNNRVQKFAAGSTSLTNGVTVAGGNGLGSALNQLNQPYGIYIDAGGNLYVSDSYNHRILKFPSGSTSATNGTVVAGGNGSGSGATQLNTPTGVSFDIAGNMYVSDFGNNRIQKFPAGSTSATNGVTVAGDGSTSASTLNKPIAVFVDASGNIYVADQHNNRILKFPVGSTAGTAATTIANGLNYANDVYVNSAGEIYADDYLNNRILKYPAGSVNATSGITVAGGLTSGSGATQLWEPNRFCFDAYGNMFVSDELNNRIQKIQVAVGSANQYVATTAGTYQAIATNSSGCSDTATAHVVCASTIYTNTAASICQGSTYSFGGHTLTTAGIYKDTLSAVSGADSIVTLTLTVNPTPSISISQHGSICTGGDTLTVVGGAGSTITWIGNGSVIGGSSSYNVMTVAGGNGSGTAANQFKVPYGVQTDAAGNIYVLDQGNNRVQKFPPNSTSANNGVTVAGGNGRGSALNQFNRPYGLYVTPVGDLYVSDSYNHRILKFAAGSTSATSGTIVAGGTGQGNGNNQLSIPCDIAFDSFGSMYVADFGNYRVQKFPAGSTSGTNGTTVAGGNGAGGSTSIELNDPIGVYIDASNNLYVADQHNSRIQKFPLGSTSSTPGVTVAGSSTYIGGNASTQLNYPNDVVLDASGNMYVCDYQNSRIQKFAPGSTAGSSGVTVAGSAGYGSGTYQFKFDNRFYIDAAGSIFISDEGNNRIQKYSTNTSTTSYIATTAGTYTAIATNSSGCSDTMTVYLTACLSDSVWPGDADHNGVDDNNDLLPIGLGYGLNGFYRADQSIIWSAHYASDWGMQFVNGTNGKHADCNGDGVIDANDTTAILLNFGFTHNKNEGAVQPWRSGIPGISLQYSRDTVAAGDTLTVSLLLGDSSTVVSSLYGLAFTYHFDPIVIDSTTARFGFVPSFMGNNINSISIHKDFVTQGSIKAAVTGINHLNRDGYGKIAEFIATITTGNINGKDLSYYDNINYITDITAIDRDGNPVPLNTGISTNQVTYEPTGIHDIDFTRVLIYPNPTKDILTIQTSTQTTGIGYSLTDVTGRVMASGKLAGEQTHISIAELASGVYMLSFDGQKQSYKIIKN